MIWQQLSEGERQAAVHTTAVGKNIDDRAVEKDWWVTTVLKALFDCECGVTKNCAATSGQSHLHARF